MSIMFIHLNEDGTVSPKKFNRIDDLFDIRLNNYHFPPAERTWGRLKEMYKALYTKENISNHQLMFFPNLRSGRSQHHNTSQLFSWLNPEDYWMLAWMGLTYSPSQVRFSCYYPIRLGCAETNKEHYYNWDTWTSPIYTVDDINTEDLKRVFTKVKNAFNNLIEKSAEKRFSPENNVSHQFTSVVSLLDRLFFRVGYFYENGGDIIEFNRVEEVLNRIEESVDFNLQRAIDQGILPYLVIKVSKKERRSIERILNYSTNVMDLLKYPMTLPKEYNPVLYGVELECSTDYSAKELVWANDEPFLICKSDGSVSGSKRNLVELVTIPASYKAHKVQWAKFFSKLSYDNFDCTKNTNNGMHVHIGATHFAGEAHVRRFTFFINNPANFDFFFKVSERTMQNINTYCQYSQPVRNRGNSIAKAPDLAKRIRGSVNFGKGTTVEVRIFKGIVSYANIIKNLEVVDSLFHYSKDCSLADMSLGSYLSWIYKTPANKYMVLKKFLEQIKNLDKMVKASQVQDIVFLERDPPKMLKAIEKFGYKMDNDHLSALNRIKGVRTFILDKTTGKVSLVGPEGIDSLNSELTQRYAAL